MRHRRPLAVALLMLACLSASAGADDHPLLVPHGLLRMSNHGLHRLVCESPLVVVARVEAVLPDGDSLAQAERIADYFEDRRDLAVLDVLRVLKGSLDRPAIEVTFVPALVFVWMHPSAARISEDTEILAFLAPSDADASGRRWSLLGARELGADELRVYERRIAELLRIRELADADARSAAEVDWLVDLVEEPVTRHEGITGLWCRRPRLVEPFACGDDPIPFLTAAHHRRLVDALLEYEDTGHTVLPPKATHRAPESATDLHDSWSTLAAEHARHTEARRLLLVLAESHDPRIDSWLARHLAATADAPTGQDTSLVQVLAQRLDDESAEDLATRYAGRDPSHDRDRAETLRQLLDLAATRLADPTEPERR